MQVKNLFLYFALLLLLPVSCISQNLSFGLKGGLNAGTPIGPAKEGASGKLGKGTLLGCYLKYVVNEKLRIQPELFFSYKGASFITPVSGDTVYQQLIMGTVYNIPTSYSGIVSGIFGNQYFDLPVLLNYKIGKRLDLLFGPQLSYLIKGKNTGTADLSIGENPNNPYTTITDEPFDQSDKINTWDYGLSGGLIYEAGKRINFNLKFTSGIRSIYKSSYTLAEGTVRNMYMQCSLDYRLGGKNNTQQPE